MKTFKNGIEIPLSWLVIQCCLPIRIEERRISRRDRKANVKNSTLAKIDDMYDYIKSLLKKCPDNITLHIGTNNTVDKPSNVVLGKLLDLKRFIEKTLPEVTLSSLI